MATRVASQGHITAQIGAPTPTPARARTKATGRRYSEYGAEFEHLLLAAWEKTPFRFPLDSQGQAISFMNKVYGYFKRLKEENLRPDLLEKIDKLTLRLEGNTLVFLRPEQLWHHEKIRQVLGLKVDQHGLTTADGKLLVRPVLVHKGLQEQLEAIRERQNGGAVIVPPFKDDKPAC